MAKAMVRVTMFPQPIEVDEDEIPGLKSQGLFVEMVEPAAAAGRPVTGDGGRRGRSTAQDKTGENSQ